MPQYDYDDEELSEHAEHDDNDYDELNLDMDEVEGDLMSFSDNFGRSEDDGWFYGDEDNEDPLANGFSETSFEDEY